MPTNHAVAAPIVPPNLLAQPLLEMRGISKRFPGVIALNAVHFTTFAGEVHALMGENGAGKSTLMKILTGVYSADEGSIHLAGLPLMPSDPRSAQRNGLAIIHQELNQVPELSVTENFFLGREIKNRFGAIEAQKMQFETVRWLKELGLQLEPTRLLKHLRVAERQLLEIAKAISLKAQVLVMDEPTTALSAAEVNQLFAVIKRLRLANMAVIYISHRMDEIFTISDRITVLRDGCYIGTEHAQSLTRERLIQMMVGRNLGELYPSLERTQGADVLRVRNLSVKSSQGKQALKNLDFTVAAGEIVGLAGLLGAGRTETLEAIYGVRTSSGEISINNAKQNLKSPRHAILAGIGFVTEDRKGQSLILARSVSENTSLAALKQFTKGLFLNLKLEQQQNMAVIQKLRVKTPSLETPVSSLSGGNQQKVVLAKYLLNSPQLLLLDEPTQGIDVGAKAEIYTIINELAQAGTAVLLASSDMPELLALCDRILVMCEGRITGQLSRQEATSARILEFATQFKTQYQETL
jgi:ribose transport system ATP-binding protein